MEVREITVKATGCHDCPLKYFSEYAPRIGWYCDMRTKGSDIYFINNWVESQTFHPNCPMKVKEESK